jgi:Na+-transporting methylmalonyl-CoA/oxaloacetate decarboxylase gamma subunit
MKMFFRNNGLSLVFMILFLMSIFGQWLMGFKEYNKERLEENQFEVSLAEYSHSGHFIQATFENWESEFLQMALFVVLTISLRQKGSSESKKIDEEEEVDREPDPKKEDAPWAVKKGGWILSLYKRSLSIVFLLLFLLSFILHFYGSFKDENEQLAIKEMPPETVGAYITDPRFWFESFQNWQSEFLSVFSIVVLSIFFRQKGSPQSKPVDAPNAETGE